MQKYIKVNSKPIIANSSVDKVPSPEIKPPNCRMVFYLLPHQTSLVNTLRVLKVEMYIDEETGLYSETLIVSEDPSSPSSENLATSLGALSLVEDD
ncbi:hypothetical protein ACFX15_012751 [Malus domestica]